MKLQYRRDELMAEAAYASPHRVHTTPLHGGFDSDGAYISPRNAHRQDAIANWEAQLQRTGATVLDCSTHILREPNYPNVAQMHFLLRRHITRPLWNSLTITGIIEGRGGVLCDYVPPNVQALTDTDISAMCLGHLRHGLMVAHGLDEAGLPDQSIGGHDRMWYVARDLLFGATAHPIPEAPSSISREVRGREMPQLPEEYEGLLRLMTDVLMIEVRAEAAFRFYEDAIRPDDILPNAADKPLALAMIQRIRQDEALHVGYLKVALSEFRTLPIKTVSGDVVPGAAILDPVWQAMVHWHGVDNYRANRPRAEESLRRQVSADDWAQLQALAA